jgi:mono/diheme cytochrome c family protein
MTHRLALFLTLLPLAACDDMSVQPKQKNYSPLVAPAATPQETVQFLERPATALPLTQALLERGQERYRIYCTPCHSELGDGNGMVVQRGFKHPPSFHEQRLREAPVDYFYDVITSGYGAMYSFAARVAPPDRWAIAAYIRALQLSQNASAADLAAIEGGATP